MNINEIESLWEVDSVIDPDNLHLESIKIPSLHAKYYEIYNNISQLKIIQDNKLSELLKDKWLYYSGKSTPEVYKEKPFDHRVMKSDLDRYISSDDEIIKLKSKIDYYELMLNYLESILKNIQNRTYMIKNSIEWLKFTGDIRGI